MIVLLNLMLLKGDSGSGKSLALRMLDQRLIHERREKMKNKEENVPIPIYIDLKQFNRSNVVNCLQMTLKQKYGGAYDPKTSKLIILMDGYDEIAGGCQQNLYDSQQLDQYSQNIRVIITCRTQYLTRISTMVQACRE